MEAVAADSETVLMCFKMLTMVNSVSGITYHLPQVFKTWKKEYKQTKGDQKIQTKMDIIQTRKLLEDQNNKQP